MKVLNEVAKWQENKKERKKDIIILTVTLNVSLEHVPPEVPGAARASDVPEGPRSVNDSKSRRKKQTSKSYKLQNTDIYMNCFISLIKIVYT